MSLVTVLVFVLVAALAAVNGSNDVPKGVATLAGAGVTKYRTAIIWGTVTTFAGCLCSLVLAEKMTKLFSKGIVTAQPTDAFAVAVLVGAASWVGLATLLRLPVSTTHALIGGLLGAGLLFASDSIAWSAIPQKLIIPLLTSVGVAYGISLLLALVFNRAAARRSESAGSPQETEPAALSVGPPRGEDGEKVAVLSAEPEVAVAMADQRRHRLRPGPQRHTQDGRDRRIRLGPGRHGDLADHAARCLRDGGGFPYGRYAGG
jgi:PiT family inorganic phosphate transporter